jgi:hypothetical protein
MVKGALGFVVSAVFVLYATTFRVVPHTSNDNFTSIEKMRRKISIERGLIATKRGTRI